MSKQTIILGGGLAGLSACYHGDGIIYEKRKEAGGQSRSKEEDGFIFDEGIHVLHTNNQYILNLMEDINVDLDIRERNAWIVSHGAMTRYPFQANTYGLPVDIVKDCLLGFIENKANNRDNIKNYEDWIYYMFGTGIADHFMIPYCKKFWGLDAKELTTDWVNVRHPKPSMVEVVTGSLEDQTKGFGVNAVYRYPKRGGFGHIGRCLSDRCGDRIKNSMEATRIDVVKKEIEFNGETKVSYKNLISTLPLPELIKIIPDVPGDVQSAVNSLRTNSIFVVNIGVNRERITDKNWIYFLEKKYPFIRVSFPFNQSDYVTPPGKSSISAEIAYGHDNPMPANVDNMGDYIISELIKCNVLKATDDIIYLDTVDIKYGYVIFDKERKTSVKRIHDYLRSWDIHPCGRYGIWAYLWSDEAILSGKKAAEKLVKV